MTLVESLPNYRDWFVQTALPWIERRTGLQILSWLDPERLFQLIREHWQSAGGVAADRAGLCLALRLRADGLAGEHRAAAGADLLLPARLGPAGRARRCAGAARPLRHRAPAGARIRRGAGRFPARPAHGDADPGRAVRDRPVGGRPQPRHPDRPDRRPADLRALPGAGGHRGVRRHRRAGAVRRLAAPGRRGRGVRRRPGHRELLADARSWSATGSACTRWR